MPPSDERQPTIRELARKIEDLRLDIEKLENRAATLQEASDASNLAVAGILQKWHTGQGVGEVLSSAQERAMADAQRLASIKSELAGAQDELARTEKALDDAKKAVEQK